MVISGDILNYSANITTGFTQAVYDVLSTVSQILSDEGIHVVNSSSDNGIGSVLESALTLSSQISNIKFQVQVVSGYNSVNDVASVINNAIYQATGSLPSATSINDQTTPQAGTPQPPTTSATPSSGSFLSSLETFGTGSLAGIAVALGGLVLFAIWDKS